MTTCQMRYFRLILILLTFNLLSCDKTADKLFWISEPTNQRNDFLFMAESTNVTPLKADSLKLFLRTDEFLRFDPTSSEYKNFGQIYKSDKFRAFVLLRSISSSGRNYVFIIRTFDNNWNTVDDFELATWDEDKKKFCYGSVNKDLIIERRCYENETSDIMEITDEGRIILTSFKKPLLQGTD